MCRPSTLSPQTLRLMPRSRNSGPSDRGTSLVLNLVMINVLALTVGACAGQRESPARSDGSVRVMTYNIRYDNPGDGLSAWPLRRDRVGQLVRFVQPDVIGLQEALADQVADLEARLPGYHWTGVGRDDGAAAGEFSPVFFREDRFRLAATGTLWLSETPSSPGSIGWDAALPRIATWVSLEGPGGLSYRVVNTHFDHVGNVARRRSAELLADSVDAWAAASPETRFVVLGDFNASPDQEPYRVLAARMRDARSIALDNHGPDETYFGFMVADTSGRSIDHIFVGPGTEVVRTAVLTDHYRGRYLSDHLPVIADVRRTPIAP